MTAASDDDDDECDRGFSRHDVRLEGGGERWLRLFEEKKASEKDDRSLLLCLHGMTESACVFFPLANDRARFRLLALDRPGYGGSSPVAPPASYSYEQFARDVEFALQHLAKEGDWGGLRLPLCGVLGHSSGGVCALALVRFCPSLFARAKCILVASDVEYANPDAVRAGISDPLGASEEQRRAFLGRRLNPDAPLLSEFGFSTTQELTGLSARVVRWYRESIRRNQLEACPGVQMDFTLERRAWGFSLSTDATSHACEIHAVYGSHDAFLECHKNVEFLRAWCATAAGCFTPHIREGRGHFDVVLDPAEWAFVVDLLLT